MIDPELLGLRNSLIAVADLEFPGGAPTPKVGTQNYYCGHFSQTGHENGKKMDRVKGTRT